MINIPIATDPNNNVVVHAAAGTGKTWLLTSRIIRLLLEGSDPGSILAITFTRKAAAEIHERVTGRLLEIAVSEEDRLAALLEELGVAPSRQACTAARDLYEKHLNAIHALRTTTFHAFCQEILRRFPLESDVPPGFELVETTDTLEDAAWQALEQKINRDGESELAKAVDTLLMACGGATNVRKALNSFVAHRSDWWAYTENKTDHVLQAAERLKILLDIDEATDSRVEFIGDPGKRDLILRYRDLLGGHLTATNRKIIDNLDRALSVTTPAVSTFHAISRAFLTEKAEPRHLSVAKTLVKAIGAEKADELVRLHRELAESLLAALKRYQRQWTYGVSRAWYISGAALLDEFQRVKTERGVLDFSDLEWKAYRLLNRSQHAEWVQYKLDQRIDHLLVDEFQDTNPTQWRLLLPLLAEMTAGDPERRRSVFLVGDEKQSIYRFRRADSRLFHEARHWLHRYARAHTYTQHISWRSSPAIIQFVNLVFHRVNDDLSNSEADYPLQDFQTHDTRHQTLWGRVELLPLIRRKETDPAVTDSAVWRNPLEQPRMSGDDVHHREEGDLIAAKIREILGMPVMEGKIARPLDANDVMVLLRDRTHARFYEEALRRAGIAYIGTGRGAFLQSLEVRDLMNLFRALVEPYNNLALASVLRSPIFAASEDDLVALARMKTGPWRERLARIGATGSPDYPLARANSLLERWRGYVDRIPVHDMLDRIYREGNMIARYTSAAPAYLRTRVESNLIRFIELALDIDSGRYPSLSRFLDRLESESDDDNFAPPAPAWNREPRVRIMTIHAAKGLEAPVVFLADSARASANREHGMRALIDWPVTEPQPRCFHLVGNKEMRDDLSKTLLHEHEASSRREEANLLYVALTRAKQFLFVSGCEPGHDDRGWYGFIERRVRQAAQTDRAERAGLRVNEISMDGGKSVFNTSALLEYGIPERLPDASPSPPVPFSIDPSLSRPFPVIRTSTVLNPSLSVQYQDDTPYDLSASSLRAESQRRGIVIHRMLEQLAGGEARAVIEMKLRLEFADWPDAKKFDSWWQEACKVLDDEALRVFFDPAGYQEARNEVPILYRDGNDDIYGIIDRIVMLEKEIIVMDYKTHAQATLNNIAHLAEAFVEQMRQYGNGARRLWPGKKIRLLLLFTACSGIVEIPLEK